MNGCSGVIIASQVIRAYPPQYRLKSFAFIILSTDMLLVLSGVESASKSVFQHAQTNHSSFYPIAIILHTIRCPWAVRVSNGSRCVRLAVAWSDVEKCCVQDWARNSILPFFPRTPGVVHFMEAVWTLQARSVGGQTGFMSWHPRSVILFAVFRGCPNPADLRD